MIAFFLSVFSLSFQEPKDIIYLREQVTVEIGIGVEETYYREIYFDKKELRIDELDSERSYIFRYEPKMIIALNHDDRVFSYGLVKQDRNLIRTMLKGLGHYADGQLQQRAGTLTPTGLKRKVSEWQCQEYEINYPSRFGIGTKIWCTNEKTIMSKADMKTLWYAIIGGSPGHDINKVVSQFFRDIPGIPIQFISKIEQQEATVTITSRIVSMEKRQIKDENFFAIPSNYQVIIPSARNN